MWKKFLAVAISVALLAPGWLGWSGLSLIVALVPMLWISSQAEDSKRGWWGVFGWVLLICVGWNLSTIMWIANATPVGPVAATIASSFITLLGFMTFHTVSKKASKALAYTVFVSLWIALEYIYTYNDFSWPWLLLGNGLSNDIWAVQWYEYTGLYGGSAWILLSNVMIFEAWQQRSKWIIAGAVATVVTPLVISAAIYATYKEPTGQQVMVSVIQPNVDCYDKFSGDKEAQKQNIIELIKGIHRDSKFAFVPETAIPGYYWEDLIPINKTIDEYRYTLARYRPFAYLISGTNTMVNYPDGKQSATARHHVTRGYYDVFNAAIGMDRNGNHRIHRKSKLVIGVENTPTWIFKLFNFFVIDLGGVVGQIGKGDGVTVFDNESGVVVGSAICYEALYGNYYADFVRNGAQFMGIISNDGWWGNTAGHRMLYSMSSLRAVETRRAIARSANTGISGFINSRGDSIEKLGWDERGSLTHTIPLNDKMTFYVRYGDYIARLAQFIAALAILYFMAYRIKRRHYLD
ncbi:MAG: apolipoprotein N-acyltransferase [Rikenellaceae bacterium]